MGLALDELKLNMKKSLKLTFGSLAMTDKYGNNANFSTSTNKFMVKGALRNFYTPHSFSLVKVRYFYTNGGNYFDSKLIINSTPEHVVPVKFYSDALKLKADILKDNRKKAGIYR